MAFKISIITVVFNRVATIERAIQSVLSQSYNDIEYIVVDGASTDGTVQVIEKYKDRIHTLVSEKDNGMYDALNKGIQLATGDIVGILHADDAFAHSEVISTIADVFLQNKYTDCVYGDVGFVKEDDPQKIVRYYSSAIFHPKLFKYGFMPAHPTFFCYKKFFDLYGYYRTDLEIAADFDLLLRYLKKFTLQSVYIPQMLVRMNMGGKSTRGLASTIKINQELKRILKEHKMPASYLRLYARYVIKVQEFWKNKKQS
ncbi:MAG TPA: glycosyltransferase family 2 protein [Lacibacter sp.]|nr:glycosyltransferase family 2 protein [Lacibacter sp.]